MGWSAWRHQPYPLRCLNRCEIVSRCAEYQPAHTLNLSFCFFFFWKEEVSWQILSFFLVAIFAATENLRRRENGREEAKKPPPQNWGDCEMTIRGEIKGRRATAGLAGNGGREEGGEGRRGMGGWSGVGWGWGVLASPFEIASVAERAWQRLRCYL